MFLFAETVTMEKYLDLMLFSCYTLQEQCSCKACLA